MNNADLRYRPILAGTSIVNSRLNEPGTLGYVAADDTGALWIVSAYHVLCNGASSPYQADEAIYQPAAVAAENLIAMTSAARANVALDCAAALLNSGFAALNRQLGIGPLSAPIEATVGMRVCKAGAVSGVTEGIVESIADGTVFVATDPAFSDDFVLSEPGDSGALWFEQQSRAPVGLHLGRLSPRRAKTVSILSALAVLQLKPI